MMLKQLLKQNIRLKWIELRLSKRRLILRMQRILRQFSRRSKHMPRKLMLRKKRIRKEKNFSKQTKPN
jgi:hypothetical protein